MGNELQQLTGMVEAVTFQNEENGFAVLSLSDTNGEMISVVGSLAGSAPGEELVLQGRFIQHPTYGRQFEAQSCAYSMPSVEPAILKYLSSGVLPGIGAVTARNIVAMFQDKALEVIATDPEQLAEVKGFTLAKAMAAHERFMKIFGVREAIASLSRMGLHAAEALQLYRYHGEDVLGALSKNPYTICGYPLYASFSRADDVAEQLSYSRESIQRVKAALIYVLRHNLQNGHTCLPKEKLLGTASDFFMMEPESCDRAFELLCENNEAQEVSYDGKTFAYLSDVLHAEVDAALRLRGLMNVPDVAAKELKKQIAKCEEAENMRYAKEQKDAMKKALSSRVLIITGGPGTGKTTTVNAIIRLFEQQADRVLLAAPTGRAAKRLAELTGRKSTTIHRLLEVGYTPGSEQPFFNRNDKNPLKCDVLIIDEMSMVDAFLFQHLLAALTPGCRLILVGDTDQLPSVSAGNVLKGAIESKVVPVVALRKIFRQAASSLIVSNAHKIVQGELPQNGNKKDDYFFIPSYGSACQKLVCDLVTSRLPTTYGFSSVAEIQVLCPGRKGLLGTETLNAKLQEILNPPQSDKPEMRHMDTVFRLGDKVMQVRNNYNIAFTRTDGEPGEGAFNGDIGFIEEMKPSTGSITVLSEDRHVYYTAESLNELELAYAITVHKSQGSEFEAVVMPLAEVPNKLRYRNLLYTGVTRAKRLCVVPGEEAVLTQMVNNGRKNARYSCFANFLEDDALF